MFFDNMKTIFSHVWAYAVVYAMLLSAYCVLCSRTMLYGETPSLVAPLCAVAMLLLCASVAYYARVMCLLNGRKMKWNLMRNIRITLVSIALLLVWAAVCWAMALLSASTVSETNPDPLTYYIIGVAAFTLIFIFLMLPLYYVVMKYFMEADSKLRKIIRPSYVTGLRHLGFICVTLLLTALCAMVCMLLISMPTVIVLAANASSVMGVRQFGDPTGLPSWFPFLQFGVITLSAFVGMFINIVVVFVMYFMYGSIEERVKEKTEYLKTKE